MFLLKPSQSFVVEHSPFSKNAQESWSKHYIQYGGLRSSNSMVVKKFMNSSLSIFWLATCTKQLNTRLRGNNHILNDLLLFPRILVFSCFVHGINQLNQNMRSELLFEKLSILWGFASVNLIAFRSLYGKHYLEITR